MPDADDVVEAVCRLPLDFYAIESVSAVDLVRRSGYLALRHDVTVARLTTCLREHPGWVDAWFAWSADNRSSPAWYVRESNPGTFELGFYEGPGGVPTETLTDKTRAAAEFVHRYLDQVIAPNDLPG